MITLKYQHHKYYKAYNERIGRFHRVAGIVMGIAYKSKGWRNHASSLKWSPRQAIQASMVRISSITLDTLLELVGGQVIHELGEDCLSSIHPSLSAIRAGCGDSASVHPALQQSFQIENASYTLSHLIHIGYSGRPDFSRTLLIQ